MKQPRTENFEKSRSCPATCLLLLCSTAELPETESKSVLGHVQACEFCAAELQLLTAHRPADEVVRVPEMPSQLRQLAETLLGGEHREFKILKALYATQEPRALKETSSLPV